MTQDTFLEVRLLSLSKVSFLVKGNVCWIYYKKLKYWDVNQQILGDEGKRSTMGYHILGRLIYILH